MSVGSQCMGRNKPPKVASQGDSRPRSVAMNSLGAGKLQLPGYLLVSSFLVLF